MCIRSIDKRLVWLTLSIHNSLLKITTLLTERFDYINICLLSAYLHRFLNNLTVISIKKQMDIISDYCLTSVLNSLFLKLSFLVFRVLGGVDWLGLGLVGALAKEIWSFGLTDVQQKKGHGLCYRHLIAITAKAFWFTASVYIVQVSLRPYLNTVIKNGNINFFK